MEEGLVKHNERLALMFYHAGVERDSKYDHTRLILISRSIVLTSQQEEVMINLFMAIAKAVYAI